MSIRQISMAPEPHGEAPSLSPVWPSVSPSMGLPYPPWGRRAPCQGWDV